jgi:squalene-hopene/tetraprenyl-beta-curcumene cyclase
MVAVGQAHGESAKRGVEYLLSTQQSDGSWDEPYFTATGFPMDFMINYHMYRNCWPLMSLGRYRKALRQGG